MDADEPAVGASLQLHLGPALLDLRVGEAILFESYADRLAAAGGLACLAREGVLDNDRLRPAVEKMAMRPLAAVGVLTLEKRSIVVTDKFTVHRTRAVHLSPLGWILLEALPVGAAERPPQQAFGEILAPVYPSHRPEWSVCPPGEVPEPKQGAPRGAPCLYCV